MVGSGELYYQGNEGVLARALSLTEKRRAASSHELSCPKNDPILAQRLQRQGYILPLNV